MNVKFSIKGLHTAQGIFKNLKKSLKPEIIDVALDAELQKDLLQFKADLLRTLTKDSKTTVSVQTPEATEEQVEIKKSDNEMIKHLTGVDLEKVSKTKNFNTLADGGLVVINNKSLRNRGVEKSNGAAPSKMSAGVNLRLPMNQGDTYESQQASARNYYNNGTFVILDNNGKAQYYENPGMDLSFYVKIVCTTDGQDDKKSNDRFNRIQNNGSAHADWTLTREGLDLVKRSFINITDIIDNAKEGDFDTAAGLINNIPAKSQKTVAVNNLSEKVSDLKTDKNLDPSVMSYNNAVKLIKNLKLEKSIKKDRTFYTLVSSSDDNVKDFADLQEKLTAQVKLWQLTKEQSYVNTLIKAIISKLRRK